MNSVNIRTHQNIKTLQFSCVKRPVQKSPQKLMLKLYGTWYLAKNNCHVGENWDMSELKTTLVSKQLEYGTENRTSSKCYRPNWIQTLTKNAKICFLDEIFIVELKNIWKLVSISNLQMDTINNRLEVRFRVYASDRFYWINWLNVRRKTHIYTSWWKKMYQMIYIYHPDISNFQKP